MYGTALGARARVETPMNFLNRVRVNIPSSDPVKTLTPEREARVDGGSTGIFILDQRARLSIDDSLTNIDQSWI